MSLDPNDERASDASVFAAPHSTMGKVGLAVSSVKLGMRLLPIAVRFFRRYPVAAAALVVAGTAWAVYSTRARRLSAHR